MGNDKARELNHDIDDSKIAEFNYKSDFDFDRYIPLWLVRTELRMRNTINPENNPKAKAIAALSKSEFRALVTIALMGPISPSEIANVIGFDRAVATRCLAELINQNLTAAIRSKTDQRSKCFHLTKKGVEICDELIPIMQNFGDYLDQSITPSEKKTLFRILEKLLTASQSYKSQ